MKRYIWSRDSAVFHDRLVMTERCNVDALADREEGDEPPEGRALCEHCAEQRRYEESVAPR